MFEIHICENLDLQIWTPYAYSRGGTKFIDMLSFSHWTLLDNFALTMIVLNSKTSLFFGWGITLNCTLNIPKAKRWIYTRVHDLKKLQNWAILLIESENLIQWVYTRVWVQGRKNQSGTKCGITFPAKSHWFHSRKYSSMFEKSMYMFGSNPSPKVRSTKGY